MTHIIDIITPKNFTKPQLIENVSVRKSFNGSRILWGITDLDRFNHLIKHEPTTHN